LGYAPLPTNLQNIVSLSVPIVLIAMGALYEAVCIMGALYEAVSIMGTPYEAVSIMDTPCESLFLCSAIVPTFISYLYKCKPISTIAAEQVCAGKLACALVWVNEGGRGGREGGREGGGGRGGGGLTTRE
jgi:uncharacterized membrane protein YgcG